MRAEVIAAISALAALLTSLIGGGLIEEAEAAFAYLVAIYSAALRADSFKERNYFTRPDLLWPEASPWAHAWSNRSDMGMTQITRLNVAAFTHLHDKLDPIWVAHRAGDAAGPRRAGRPNMLDSYAVLALTLCWFSSTCQMKHLELIFGAPHSVLSRDLKEGKQQLLLALGRCPEALILWPESLAEFEHLAKLMSCAYYEPPLLGKWFGLIDGLRLYTECPRTEEEQRRMYNGWAGATCCISVLVFSPQGKIIWVTRNHPGRQNDVGSIYFLEKLMVDRTLTPAGFSLIGDVGFTSRHLEGIVDTKTPPKSYDMDPQTWKKFARWLTTTRQAVEWGMRVLQSNWKRLTVLLPADSFERRDILDTVFMLHNFLTHHCGHNQIKTVYIEACLRGGLNFKLEEDDN
jgi:hypothetical protein